MKKLLIGALAMASLMMLDGCKKDEGTNDALPWGWTPWKSDGGVECGGAAGLANSDRWPLVYVG